jgi:hypothetical protein
MPLRLSPPCNQGSKQLYVLEEIDPQITQITQISNLDTPRFGLFLICEICTTNH